MARRSTPSKRPSERKGSEPCDFSTALARIRSGDSPQGKGCTFRPDALSRKTSEDLAAALTQNRRGKRFEPPAELLPPLP